MRSGSAAVRKLMALIKLKTGDTLPDEAMEMETLPPPLIRDIFSQVIPEVNEFETDPLRLAELELSKAEFQLLFKEYSDQPATIETLKPFVAFLRNRCERVLGKEKQPEEKKEAKAETKVEEKITNTAVKLPPDLGTDFIYPYASSHDAATLLSMNLANAIHKIHPFCAHKSRKEKEENLLQKREERLVGLLQGENKRDSNYTHPGSAILTGMRLLRSEIRSAPRLYRLHWEAKKEEKKPNPINSRQINSLLMPTISDSYYYPAGYNEGEHTTIDNLQRDKFILTDDGKSFIPVLITMKRAAEQSKETGKIEFKTSVNFEGSYILRNLTSSEENRLLLHSPEVTKYYRAIEASIEWNKKRRNGGEKTSVENILENFLKKPDGQLDLNNLSEHFTRHLTIGFIGLETPKQKLFSMRAFCSHCNEEKTFGDLLAHSGRKKSDIQKNRTNLHAFLARYKLTLHTTPEFQKIPPLDGIEMEAEDPLVRATREFEAAMQGPLKVTPGYGAAGRQRLLNTVYQEETFPRVIEIFSDTRSLANYLIAMPAEKIPAFFNQLAREKLSELFNEPVVTDIELARIWRFLPEPQKEFLKKEIKSKSRLERIMAGSEKDFDENFIFASIRATQKKRIEKLVLHIDRMSDEKLEDFLCTLSSQQLVPIFNRAGTSTLNLVRIWKYLSDSQKISLIKNVERPAILETVLNNQPDKNKDYEIARQHLENALGDSDSRILTMINRAKNITPLSELHLLTEFTYRTALSLQYHNNVTNNQRCSTLTQRFSKDACKNFLKGALLLIAGAGLITTATLLALASGGISTPLSGAAIYMGTQLSAAGVAVLAVGSAIMLTGAGHYLTNGTTYRKLSRTGLQFFDKDQDELKYEVPDDRRSLNSETTATASLQERLLERQKKGLG